MRKLSYILIIIGMIMILIGSIFAIKDIEAKTKYNRMKDVADIYVDKATCNEYYIVNSPSLVSNGIAITPRYSNGNSGYIMQNVDCLKEK